MSPSCLPLAASRSHVRRSTRTTAVVLLWRSISGSVCTVAPFLVRLQLTGLTFFVISSMLTYSIMRAAMLRNRPAPVCLPCGWWQTTSQTSLLVSSPKFRFRTHSYCCWYLPFVPNSLAAPTFVESSNLSNLDLGHGQQIRRKGRRVHRDVSKMKHVKCTPCWQTNKKKRKTQVHHPKLTAGTWKMMLSKTGISFCVHF